MYYQGTPWNCGSYELWINWVEGAQKMLGEDVVGLDTTENVMKVNSQGMPIKIVSLTV